MSEFLSRNISFLISKTPESSYNTPKTLGTDFTRCLMRGSNFIIPNLEGLDDADKTGTGHEWATNLRPNYWSMPVLPVGEDVNTDKFALFVARAFGGTTETPTQLIPTTGLAYEHILLLAGNNVRQLPSSHVITSVGYVDGSNPGGDFGLMGMVVDNFTVSQNRADTPQYSVEMVGSGRFAHPAGLTSLPDTVDDQHYAHGASVIVTYNDGTAINLSTDGRLRSWTCRFSNQLRRDDRRPGDPFRVANDPTSGAYGKRLLRGPRQCSAELTVSLAEDLREFVTHSSNRTIQSLKFTMKGELIETGNNQTAEITMPLSYLRNIAPANEGDDAALTLTFFPVKGSGEYISARFVNADDTAIV